MNTMLGFQLGQCFVRPCLPSKPYPIELLKGPKIGDPLQIFESYQRRGVSTGLFFAGDICILCGYQDGPGCRVTSDKTSRKGGAAPDNPLAVIGGKVELMPP